MYLFNHDWGFFTHRLPWARAAADHGLDVHVALPLPDAAFRLAPYGLTGHTLHFARGFASPRREATTFADMIRVCRRVKPDILHAITPKGIVYGGVVARSCGVPAAVYTVTGLGLGYGLPGLRGQLVKHGLLAGLRVAFSHPNAAVILQNPDDQHELIARGAIRRAHTALIRGSGVDLAQFAARPLPNGPPTVVLASRLIWSKGVREFIDAAELVRTRLGCFVRFLLVGESDTGSPDAVPTEQLRRWHDRGQVEWLGQRDDMPEIFARSHVVCLPSRGREGVPKTLIEAAAVGRALVASDVPGCREIVRDRHNGLLVPARDAPALADALVSLLTDRATLERMSFASRSVAENEFSLDSVTREMLRVYEKLL